MNGNFVYRAGAYEYYDVTYWQLEEGVILYNYSRKKLNAEEMAYETLLILLLAGAAYSEVALDSQHRLCNQLSSNYIAIC